MPNAVKKAILIATGFLGIVMVLHIVLRFLPYPELESYAGRPYGYAVYDRDGRLLRVFPAEDGTKREWVPLKEIPSGVLQIFIRAEDRRFYLHRGVDPAAVVTAGLRNMREERVVSGASTITMQLARLIKPHGQGLRGKISEACDAFRLEARLSKKQILELWINGIPFGSNIEGLPAASRTRFGREPSGLDDARAALLAVIPRRPGMYDPAHNPQAAVGAALSLSRRCRLKLDEAALAEAAADAAPDMLADLKSPFYAPHFTDRVAFSEILSRRDAETQRAQKFDTGNAPRLRGSARNNHKKIISHSPITTTLDLDLQLYAEKRLVSELSMLGNNRVSNGAILAIDNANGNVLAYAGSASWFDDANSGKIDGVRVLNQPGSCLKPFLYALALEKGFAPNDILPDIPTVFGSAEAYSPANFNRRFNGPVRFRLALASSLNVPAVYLVERLGVRNFEDWLAGLGFESIAANRGSYGAGIALGNAEVSLEEMVRAFAAFPRGGSVPQLCFTGHQPGNAATEEMMSPYSAWAVTDILSDRASRFVGFGPAPVLSTEFPSMFKTGTANQFQHIWALGATARFTVGVWMGNFSGETVIGRTGSSIPARIASDLLKALEQGLPPEAGGFTPVPGSAREFQICTLSGMETGPYCSGSAHEWLPADKPPEKCSWHRRPDGSAEYPGEYQAWLYERFLRGQAAAGSFGNTQIRLPVTGSVFYFNPGLPPEAQAIRIETAGFGPGAAVYANDELRGAINQAGVFIMPLSRSLRRITVEDENGSSSADITVR